MRPDKQRPPALPTTWRSMIAFALIVAVALIVSWAWRDGLSWGDVIGGLVTGAVTFATLAALRQFRGS
jgi:hypothetical protein